MIAGFLTEALTELGVKSEIFSAPREKLSKLNPWLEKLLKCGYCFSFWTALGVAPLVGAVHAFTGIVLVDMLLSVLIVQRLSNWMHNICDKWTDKYYSMSHINTEK